MDSDIGAKVSIPLARDQGSPAFLATDWTSRAVTSLKTATDLMLFNAFSFLLKFLARLPMITASSPS